MAAIEKNDRVVRFNRIRQHDFAAVREFEWDAWKVVHQIEFIGHMGSPRLGIVCSLQNLDSETLARV